MASLAHSPVAPGPAASAPHPYLTGLHRPMEQELTLTGLKVVGELPAALDGRYLRIGPNPVAPDPEKYHWFVGDGMVHGLRIKDGQALWYRNRWIGSSAAATALGRQPASGPRRGRGDVVNTNVLALGGRTFALVEAGSYPVVLSDDLEEQSYSSFDDTLVGSFTAHPHRDLKTGEHHAICYDGTDPTEIRHVILDSAGKVTREQAIEVRNGPSIHDCAVSGKYVVILDLPVTLSIKAAMAGFGMPYRWNREHAPRVGLLPKTGGAADIVWCDVDPAYVFHTVNAYDLPDGRVVLDVCAYPTMFDDQPKGPNQMSRGLERWTVDPATRRVSTETLEPSPQDFPRIDERFEGERHRFVFAAALAKSDGEQSGGAIGLYRHDLEAGSRQFHDFGEGRHPGEFVFVPAAADSPEGVGWLVGLVVDARAETTEFVVLDAMTFEAEPVARVQLPHLVPQGFHGNWIATETAA